MHARFFSTDTRSIRWITMILLHLMTNGTFGQAPHEVLLLVNQNSPRSLEVANHFVHLRGIPPRHVVYLDLPDTVREPVAELSRDEFTHRIWQPAMQAMKEREIEDQILAWIYSVDFPVRIRTTPHVSLTGLTFLRNELPEDPDLIAKGLYRSPLFVGPDMPDAPMSNGGSFVRFQPELLNQMPLPAMMLGFCGSRGTSVDTVLHTLNRGRQADGSRPSGTVYWQTHPDIRSEIRTWQQPIAIQELAELNIRSVQGEGTPTSLPGIIGLQMGFADVNTATVGRWLPGSMAEHLTSHGAEFHLARQTKISDWLRAGATATAGTVTEPYAIWTKFPHARFFAHYGRGNSILESFYLSIRSPAQILLLGEPLARPWLAPLRLAMGTEHPNPQQGTITFHVATQPALPPDRMEYDVLVNGQSMGPRAQGTQFSFDSAELADGHHTLSVAGYIRGPVTHTITVSGDLIVDHHGRSVHLRLNHPETPPTLQDTLSFAVEAKGDPDRLELVHNERVLASWSPADAAPPLAANRLGAGPVSLYARATYADDMTVSSAPWTITIERGTPLRVQELRKQDAQKQRTTPEARQARLSTPGAWQSSGTADWHYTATTNTYDICMFPETRAGVRTLSAQLHIPSPTPTHPHHEWAGLVFHYQDARHFDFFVLYGRRSAWSFGRVRNGKPEFTHQRGALLLRGTAHRIDLVPEGDQLVAYVNESEIMRIPLPSGESDIGPAGLIAAGEQAEFTNIRWTD